MGAPSSDAKTYRADAVPSDWSVVRCESLTSPNFMAALLRLFAGAIPAIEVPGAIPLSDCRRAVERFASHGEIQIGPMHEQFIYRSKDDYFAAVKATSPLRQELFSGIVDPIAALMSALGEHRSCVLAEEPDGRRYLAGLVRRCDASPIHYDFASTYAQGWACADITAMLSAFAVLDHQGGGDITVYRSTWRPEHEQFRIFDGSDAIWTGGRGDEGYRSDVVDGVASATLSPAPGALLLYNSQYYHEFTGDSWVTTSCFLGDRDGHEILVWS
jgi:hypothetical protein